MSELPALHITRYLLYFRTFHALQLNLLYSSHLDYIYINDFKYIRTE